MHCNAEPKRWHSLVETYRLYGMLYPEIAMRTGVSDTMRIPIMLSGMRSG